MFEGFERKSVSVLGVDIACVIGGSGPPTLLLHGFPQNRAMWARVGRSSLSVSPSSVQISAATVIRRNRNACRITRTMPSVPWPPTSLVSCENLVSIDSTLLDMIVADGPDTEWPSIIQRLYLHFSVLDIVPTYTMMMETNRRIAHAYWHWSFLSQPEPFPERVIGNDPDFFYENCLLGWGATKLADFDQDMLIDYRRCWRNPAMIHGSCSDYRAAATIDLDHDGADVGRRVVCPTLVVYGAAGTMARLFNIPAEWKRCCETVAEASL